MTSASQPNVDELIARYLAAKGGGSGGNAQTITVTANAGVFGVWVATTACLVMLACGVLGSLWVSREFARYDAEIAKLQAKDAAQAAYVQQIWRAAPHLKPKE